MQRCFDLATLARGKTGLNPLVGAVLVFEGRIIGEGWHRHYGGPHAEVNAIASVKKEDRHLIKKSTLYVSLEPCSHFGKTPPCTDLILQYEIPKVVVGMTDPNPLVSGNGIRRLKNSGVHVITDVCKEKAQKLNRVFLTNQHLKRPFITIKFAQSTDGFLGKKNKRTPISNPVTNQWVHKLRSENDAIGVGRKTAEIDNPQLTTRLYPGKSPMRLLFSKSGIINANWSIFDRAAASCLIGNFCPQDLPSGLTFIKKGKSLTETFRHLYSELKIGSILIEGGSELIQSILSENLWDEIIQITGDTSLEKGIRAPDLSGLSPVKSFSIINDDIKIYRRTRGIQDRPL